MGEKMKIYKRFSFTIIVYFVGLSLLGICMFPLIPIKESPTQNLQQLTVSFSMNGQSPRIIEHKVTAPLEGVLSRVAGVTYVESKS